MEAESVTSCGFADSSAQVGGESSKGLPRYDWLAGTFAEQNCIGTRPRALGERK